LTVELCGEEIRGARTVLPGVSVACTLGAALGCEGLSSREGSQTTALTDLASASAPELISIEFEDPAVVSAEVDVSVLAVAPDGAIDGLRVEIHAAAPPVELALAEVNDSGGLFMGSFIAPAEEGEHLLTVIATSAGGEQVEETVVAFAAASGGWCTATCYKNGEVVATQTKTTSSGEFCEIFCSRFCFGPQGNGATDLLCEFSPR
jgi:hypothetical protein